MNLSRTLKTLPLVGALAMGLALTPAISMADDDHRGRDKNRYSHDAGKSHKKTYKQEHRVHKKEWKRDHNSYRNHHSRKHVDDHRHGWKKRHHKYYGHKHDHHGHRHQHVIVRDYGHHDHYVDFDDLRFMIGLHTDNVDIIFRD